MATKKTDARDALDSGVSNNESSELNAITVKTLTNLEEKVGGYRLETLGDIQHNQKLC